ncbi:hypothetical protein T492DRAFT_831536 [Pavlovales sp. CCMP2436]|nr:hypothetical protein T492DRAFT_831536 [Pavlovales sp. CCMP2436]
MAFVKTEYFDEEVMRPILSDDRFNSIDRKRLTEYNKHRINGGKVHVSYTYGAGCAEKQLGRLFPENGIGLQALRFDLLSSSRKKAKTEFLKVLYGGNLQLFREDYQEIEGNITPEGLTMLKDVKIEMDALMEKIWYKHSELHNLKIGKDQKKISKKLNPKASLMAILFQTYERHLLLEWDTFLSEKGRYLSVYIHDGGYISKLDGEKEFPPELLIEGSTRLNEKLGYKHIKLTQKEISHEWTSKVKPFVKLANDDNHAAIIILEELKDSLIYYERQLFYKKNHIWLCDPEKFEKYLLNYILTSEIFLPPSIEDGKPVKYSGWTTKAKNISAALNYKEYFDNPNYDVIKQIKESIYDNLYGEDCQTALNALSRAFAGHCEDKNFIEYCGNRNCGKGIQFDNLKSAFGGYVNSFELETPSVEKNLKINGQLWKKLSGGNDDHILMGNNWLTYDTADVLEHRLAFSSSVQFKSKETIDDMIEEGEDQRLIDAYKIRDDSLRDKCFTEKWMNATVYLMLQHYVNKSVPVKKQEFDQDDDDDISFKNLRLRLS